MQKKKLCLSISLPEFQCREFQSREFKKKRSENVPGKFHQWGDRSGPECFFPEHMVFRVSSFFASLFLLFTPGKLHILYPEKNKIRTIISYCLFYHADR